MRGSIAIAAVAGMTLALGAFAWRGASAGEAPRPAPVVAPPPKPAGPPPLTGVDLGHLEIEADEVTAPAAAGRVAHLTLDPALQRAALEILRGHKIPEAAVVVTDVATGRVRVWASHVQKGPSRDLCAEASAPAASVFKIVTASSLVENAGLGPDTKQCYSGGENRINTQDLVDDPRRDRWCATLAEALGRSINTVFARLAQRHLTREQLGATAAAFGFGDAPPFDVAVAPSQLHFPDDKLGFARTAAGFWNTTLSPLEGAMLASTIASGGELVRPSIVARVTQGDAVLFEAPAERTVVRRALKPATAAAVGTMMEATVTGGTSFRAFHDAKGRSLLGEVAVAGKTGTLTRADAEKYYTWFVGYAPAKAPEVAISVLVVNGPKWRVKANAIARDVLRAHFAARGASGVSAP